MRCVSRVQEIFSRRSDPIFSHVAQFYDALMDHVNYASWVDYIQDAFQRLDIHSPRVADVACGTGTPTLMLAQRGVKIVGIDASWAMVRQAKAKANEQGISVPFFVQDMRSLALSRPVDAILCLYDSVNFLLTEKEVKEAFRRAWEGLRPGGLYLFDVVTERNILLFFDGNVYAEKRQDFSYRWTNRYDSKTRVCLSHITGECVQNGERHRFHEVHHERVYPVETLSGWLGSSGFKVHAVREAFTRELPKATSNRVHFECLREG